MTAIMNFLTIVDDFVWGPPMLIILAHNLNIPDMVGN